MTLFPISILILLIFANRYLIGPYLRRLRGAFCEETIAGYEPTVTIVTPMLNEGESIYHTVRSLLGQDYPPDKLAMIVVDDGSSDDSYAWACRAAEGHPNVTVLRNPRSVGKRIAINRAVRRATSEIIVSVDSDVVVDRQAIRQLVSRFTRPDIAAVGGRVYVLNANQNWLTRMQAIKYYFGYEYLKSIERAFYSVMCLSGCLTAYRRAVLLELEPILEDRNVLGVPIKYGEDRFLTRQIVKAGYRTYCTLDAFCYTKAPSTFSKYFAQQLRWRRSNIIDFLGGISHAWRLHPCITIHYLSLCALLIAYPLVIFTNVVQGDFWPLAMNHLALLAAFGTLYALDTRSLPAAQRVHPLAFLAMGVVMPVTYIVCTVLALFTLDSSSWETRGGAAASATLPPPEPAPPTSLETPSAGSAHV